MPWTLKALGADHVINYLATPNWANKTKAFTDGRGVDRILEVGGQGTLSQSIQACRMHGQIALIGVLTGYAGEVPTALLALSQLTVTGIYVGSRDDQNRMVAAFELSDIKPKIDQTFGLPELKSAFEYQSTGKHFGKIVVEY